MEVYGCIWRYMEAYRSVLPYPPSPTLPPSSAPPPLLYPGKLAASHTPLHLRSWAAAELGRAAAPLGLSDLARPARPGLTRPPVNWALGGSLSFTLKISCRMTTFVLYYTIIYNTILYYVILHYTILYYTILDYTILFYIIQYCIVLYYTEFYYTILYYTMLYCTVLN